MGCLPIMACCRKTIAPDGPLFNGRRSVPVAGVIASARNTSKRRSAASMEPPVLTHRYLDVQLDRRVLWKDTLGAGRSKGPVGPCDRRAAARSMPQAITLTRAGLR